MTKVNTSLGVNFGQGGEGGGPSLSIEGDPGFYTGTDIHLLLFPGVDALIMATDGSIVKGSVRPWPVPPGVVQFSGGDSASLPRPPVFSTPSFSTLFSFNSKGVGIGISVHYDPETRSVKASKPCYAAVKHSAYISSALSFTYIPALDVSGGAVKATFGMIAAYYPPTSITTYQVDPTGVDDGNVETELYRVVSNAVTTGDGEFEKPPGYPATGTYPGKALSLDVETSLMTQRVHEIGYMDGSGRGYVRQYYVTKLEPYSLDFGYKPATSVVISPLSKDKYSQELINKAKNFIKSRGYGK